MALFNLTILNTFIETYVKIRRHKNKGQATDDEIDRKCTEIKQKFADIGNNPNEWAKLFSYLGGIADGSQNNKMINHMPSFIRSMANLLPSTQITETQSDLSQAIWALIHYLHRIIFNTTFTQPDDVNLQAQIRAAMEATKQALRQQRDSAFQEWNNAFVNEKSTDAEVATKEEAYYKLEMELIYVGDTSHFCMVIPTCYTTYSKPDRKRLGVNSTDPMQDNHRIPSVAHADYDRYYISKVMMEDERRLIDSYQHVSDWPASLLPQPPEVKQDPAPGSSPASTLGMGSSNNVLTPSGKPLAPQPMDNQPSGDTPENKKEPATDKSPKSSTAELMNSLKTSPSLSREQPLTVDTNQDEKQIGVNSAAIPTKIPSVEELMAQLHIGRRKAKAEHEALIKAAKDSGHAVEVPHSPPLSPHK